MHLFAWRTVKASLCPTAKGKFQYCRYSTNKAGDKLECSFKESCFFPSRLLHTVQNDEQNDRFIVCSVMTRKRLLGWKTKKREFAPLSIGVCVSFFLCG